MRIRAQMNYNRNVTFILGISYRLDFQKFDLITKFKKDMNTDYIV